MNDIKMIDKLLMRTWKNDLKKLPEYQKKEIRKAAKIETELKYFVWSVISFIELKNNLRKIIKGE